MRHTLITMLDLIAAFVVQSGQRFRKDLLEMGCLWCVAPYRHCRQYGHIHMPVPMDMIPVVEGIRQPVSMILFPIPVV